MREQYPATHYSRTREELNSGAVTRAIAAGRTAIPLIQRKILPLSTPSQLRDQITLIKNYGLATARHIEAAALMDPSRVGIIDDMGQRTYAGMRDDIRALARALSARGVGEKSRIGIMCRNSRALVYSLAVKGYLGADAYLLNVFSSEKQLRDMIREHHLDFVVIDSEFAHYVADLHDDPTNPCTFVLGWVDPTIDAASAFPGWTSFQELIDASPSGPLPESTHSGVLVVMSSGTSGTPKGVIHPEISDLTSVSQVLKAISWRAGLTIQLTASAFHFWGWGNLNLALVCRCTIIMRRVFNAEQNVDDIEKYGVEGVISAAIFLKQVVQECDARRQAGREVLHDSVKFVVSSGNLIHSVLVKDIMGEFGPILYNFYGSTEVGLVSCATPEMLAANPRSAGCPFDGVKVALLDEDGREVEQGEVGLIYAVSPLSLTGYTNDRDLIESRGELIRIGDRGFIDDRGLLQVVGRGDDMIINGGENVYPKSVEDVLAKLPGVADLFVNGVEDEISFSRIRAYVVREKNAIGQALTKEKIQHWIRQNLAEHSVPRDVIWMDRMPRNDMGKVVPRFLPHREEQR